jgi:hypothetical protein
LWIHPIDTAKWRENLECDELSKIQDPPNTRKGADFHDSHLGKIVTCAAIN